VKRCGSRSLTALYPITIFAIWPSSLLACTVSLDRSDVVLPLEKMEPAAICRLAEVANDYTTFQLVPSVQVPIPKTLYDFLLDHPALTSNAVRHYRFGGYVVTEVSPTVFTGEDNQGGEATVTLLYQDPVRRIYHLQGSQKGYVIPKITGAGIVLLSYQATPDQDGRVGVDTRVTVFSRLDNRFLANLVKLMRPILQRLINDKLTRGVKTVNRLTEFLAKEPAQVGRDADSLAGNPQEAQMFRALLSKMERSESSK
jgi:hypothetical protein